MDVPYQRTFLRSALAKDPFALGDFLGPEDVLRIEEEYPNLFNPMNLHPKEEPKPKANTIPSKVIQRPPLHLPTGRHSTGNINVNPRVHKTISFAPRSAPPKSILKASPQKPQKPQPKPNTAISGRVIQPQPPSPCSRAVRYVSVEELKKVLKELLHEKQHQKKGSRKDKFTLPQSPCEQFHEPSVKTIKNAAKYAELRRLIQEEWDDKVKLQQSIARMTNNGNSPRNSSRPSTVLKKNRTVFDEPLVATAISVIQKQTNQESKSCNEARKKKPTKRATMKEVSSRSGPGFLRTEPSIRPVPVPRPRSRSSPRVENKEKLNKPDSITSKRVSFSPPKSKPKEPSLKESDKSSNHDRSDTRSIKDQPEKVEEASDSVSSSSQNKHFHVKGVATTRDNDHVAETDLGLRDKFQERSHVMSKHERIELLRTTLNSRPFERSEGSKRKTVLLQTDPSTARRQGNVETKGVPTNSSVLEAIARELLYAEIMKHMQTLQERERNQAAEFSDDQEDPTSSSQKVHMKKSGQPLSIPSDRAKYSTPLVEASDSSITTPNLSHSYPNTPRQKKLDTELDVFPSPETPEVSQTPRKHENAIRETPGNPNDATDCSEISECVFCTPSEKGKTPPSKLKRKNCSNRTPSSISITTPILSISNRGAKGGDKKVESEVDSKSIACPSMSVSSLANDTRDNFLNESENEQHLPFHSTPKMNTPRNLTKSHNEEEPSSKTPKSITKTKQKSGESQNNKTRSSTTDVKTSGLPLDEDEISTVSSSPGYSVFGMISEGEFIGGKYVLTSPGELQQASETTPDAGGGDVRAQDNYWVQGNNAAGGISVGEYLGSGDNNQ